MISSISIEYNSLLDGSIWIRDDAPSGSNEWRETSSSASSSNTPSGSQKEVGPTFINPPHPAYNDKNLSTSHNLAREEDMLSHCEGVKGSNNQPHIVTYVIIQSRWSVIDVTVTYQMHVPSGLSSCHLQREQHTCAKLPILYNRFMGVVIHIFSLLWWAWTMELQLQLKSSSQA